MIEISIVVQIREVAGDKKGRIAIGFSKIETETLVPKKVWSRNFFAAVERAIANRRKNLEEIQRIAREELPLFRVPF
jgi:poly(A) polymerase Pap1